MSSRATTAVPLSLRLRRGALPVVLWAFGFATSLMLIGMWGRTVSVDASTIQRSAQEVVDSDVATERVRDWLASGLETVAGVEPAAAQGIVTGIAQQPEFENAIDVMVGDFVGGLFAVPGQDPVVRVEEALDPLVPVVAAEARRRDIPIEEGEIEQALAKASEIELDTGEAVTFAAAVTEARALLTKVVLLAAVLLATTAGLAIALSERPYVMLRSLSTRVLVSALSYALLFRVAAWALDPQKGRAPILGGGSVVLGSNSHVFVIAAVVAGLLGLWGGTVAWRRARSKPTFETPVAEDDTREFATVG